MRANGRYMALGLRPALWMAVPMVLLLIHLEAFYGRAPLPVGRDAVLTVALRPPDNGSVPELLLPPGVVLSAPPVRVLDGAEVSWRIRPVMPVSGQLRIRVGGEIFTKSIEAGGRPTFLAGRRTDSQLAALWYADEPPLGKGRVAWIDLPYPEARVGVFGVEVPWILWFIVVSMLAALALRKRFGVSL